MLNKYSSPADPIITQSLRKSFCNLSISPSQASDCVVFLHHPNIYKSKHSWITWLFSSVPRSTISPLPLSHTYQCNVRSAFTRVNSWKAASPMETLGVFWNCVSIETPQSSLTLSTFHFDRPLSPFASGKSFSFQCPRRLKWKGGWTQPCPHPQRCRRDGCELQVPRHPLATVLVPSHWCSISIFTLLGV